jgi:hypothetical protein
LITVAGWHGCDHTGPVREGDTLVSTIIVEDLAVSTGVRVLTLRVQVCARRDTDDDPVLDWRLVTLSR